MKQSILVVFFFVGSMVLFISLLAPAKIEPFNLGLYQRPERRQKVDTLVLASAAVQEVPTSATKLLESLERSYVEVSSETSRPVANQGGYKGSQNTFKVREKRFLSNKRQLKQKHVKSKNEQYRRKVASDSSDSKE